jgi:hypothetical protein
MVDWGLPVDAAVEGYIFVRILHFHGYDDGEV